MELLEPAMPASDGAMASFPELREVWIPAVSEGAAQWDAYGCVEPVAGRRVLQLGGTGIHALKAIRAGAAEAWLLTPVPGEALLAEALPRHLALTDRPRCIVGVAEEQPFGNGGFDVIVSSGCLHHTQIDRAVQECARVLCSGGRFAAWDPWRAPVYGVGTKISGKREPGGSSRPMTAARAEPLERRLNQRRSSVTGRLQGKGRSRSARCA